MRQFFTKNAQHGNQKRSSSALTPQAIATTPVDSHHPSGTFPVCTHPNSSALAKLVSPFQTQQPVQCKVNNAAALILDRQNRWRSTEVPPNKNLGSDSLCAKSHSCWPAVQILHFKQGLPVLKLQSTGSSTGWVVYWLGRPTPHLRSSDICTQPAKSTEGLGTTRTGRKMYSNRRV